jgi:hypothetical protein
MHNYYILSFGDLLFASFACLFFSFHSPKEPNERENVGNETQKQKKNRFRLPLCRLFSGE